MCEFPAHRNYAVTRVSATGFEPGPSVYESQIGRTNKDILYNKDNIYNNYTYKKVRLATSPKMLDGILYEIACSLPKW